MARNQGDPEVESEVGAEAPQPTTPNDIVNAMRGNAIIDTEADNTPAQSQLLVLMSEMRTQAENMGYDVSGKVSATIEGEPVQLVWSFNRLKKGATG